MKRVFTVLICCMLFLAFCIPCRAVGVSAVSAVLIDGFSGRVIYEKNANSKMSMASTTKIMTALCAIENSQLDKKITVNPAAVGVEGSSIYLKNGERLTIRELVYGLMLSSGNDAAVAIAYAVSGSIESFAELMNKTAGKIGVKNTHFVNPNGLDAEGHYTTAYDLAQISAYAMKNEEFRKIVSTYRTTISYEGQGYDRQLKNHNKLLKMYDGCIGVKTGFTKKSGRCLVSAAEKNGVTLVAVTLKAPDDWNDHINMLNYGFERVTLKNVLKKDDYVCTVAVKNGTQKTVKLVLEDSFDIPQILGITDKVSIKYKIPGKIAAPVGYRQCAGKVNIYLNGKCVGEVNAVTDATITADNSKNLKRSAFLIFTEFVFNEKK